MSNCSKCGGLRHKDRWGRWRCQACNTERMRNNRATGAYVDKRRNHRNGVVGFTCTCKAYPYPHLIFTGRCRPLQWVKNFFDPCSQACSQCTNYNEGDCQVTTEVESPFNCPELRELVRYESIQLYGRAKELWDRTERHAR